MKQDQKRYKQLPGFPGYQGAVVTTGLAAKPLTPLTEAEKADLQRAGIPHDPELPHAYVPPPGPYTRRIGIELLGPLGLAAIVLTLFAWLLSVPASGEKPYYGDLLQGKITQAAPEHSAAAGAEHSETAPQ